MPNGKLKLRMYAAPSVSPGFPGTGTLYRSAMNSLFTTAVSDLSRWKAAARLPTGDCADRERQVTCYLPEEWRAKHRPAKPPADLCVYHKVVPKRQRNGNKNTCDYGGEMSTWTIDRVHRQKPRRQTTHPILSSQSPLMATRTSSPCKAPMRRGPEGSRLGKRRASDRHPRRTAQ